MSNTVEIHPPDKIHLFQLHNTFGEKACRSCCSVLAASFLITGALIVIYSASLCLALPGVNVVNQVILKGYLPAAVALILSIPFVIYGLLKSREQKEARTQLIDFNVALFNWYQIDTVDRRTKVDFIKKNFFDRKWSKMYSSRLIKDIKARYPKKKEDQTDEVRALFVALDKALIKVYKRK